MGSPHISKSLDKNIKWYYIIQFMTQSMLQWQITEWYTCVDEQSMDDSDKCMEERLRHRSQLYMVGIQEQRMCVQYTKDYQGSLLTLAPCDNILMDKEERLRRRKQDIFHMARDQGRLRRYKNGYRLSYNLKFIYCTLHRCSLCYMSTVAMLNYCMMICLSRLAPPCFQHLSQFPHKHNIYSRTAIS